MRDFHTHTTFSDGKDSPEEMVKAAIHAGMDTIGFSDHSFTAFDLSYCMKEDDYEPYKAEIARLKEKYKKKIRILCGIEQDAWSKVKPVGFDYIVGSAHYIRVGRDYFPVDDGADILTKAAFTYFGGDIYGVIETYFDTVSKVVEKTGCDLIGHFDLIKKYNVKTPFFDEDNPRYVNAKKAALDKLISYNVPFEINTGSISRGYRQDSYPDEETIAYILEKGGKVVCSSDSHTKDNLCFGFEAYKEISCELNV